MMKTLDALTLKCNQYLQGKLPSLLDAWFGEDQMIGDHCSLTKMALYEFHKTVTYVSTSVSLTLALLDDSQSYPNEKINHITNDYLENICTILSGLNMELRKLLDTKTKW